MNVCKLREMLSQIPDDAEIMFEWDMIYLDDCTIEKYPEKFLGPYRPFYYIRLRS
jgi:hypothetical protein